MNITKTPNINVTDLFGITESYSKKPDNLPTLLIIKVMPKIKYDISICRMYFQPITIPEA